MFRLSSLLGFAAATLVFSLPANAAPPPYAGQEPARYRNAVGPQQPMAGARWWEDFRDSELNRLVVTGAEQNFDVAASQSRVDEADAVVIQQFAPLLPTASWDSSITVAPTDTLGFGLNLGGVGGDAEVPTLYYQASSALNVGLDLDITGRNVLNRRASKLDRAAAKADVEAAKQDLAVRIVRAYYDVVAARAQLNVVEQQLETNKSVLELTELRFESGQVNAVDVLQQRQQLAATKTLIPQAQLQVATFEQQLSVLLGTPPGPISTPQTLPKLSPTPGVGTPGDLQRSRPDLRAAQKRLDGIRKRIKSSRRQFAPSLRLNGQGGVQALWIDQWNSQGFWNATATLSVPLFTGLSTYGQMKQTAAQERTANYQLSQGTLAAIQEVETALVTERVRTQALEFNREQEQAATAAFEESRKRYAAGLSEYLPVLTALSSVQQAELNTITAHRDLIAARIDLYAALGDR